MSSYPQPHAVVLQLYQRATEWIMRSYPLKDLPLRIRPGIIFATAAWLLLLGVIGFAPLPTLPINDKALHFFGLGFATFLIYFVVDVPEGPARRVWYIRRAPLLLTLLLAFFFGGIISEFVQSVLPWKSFQIGDIVANLFGSVVFLYLAHFLHQRSRRRQELSDLYQPLSAQNSATYRDAQGRQHGFSGRAVTPGSAGTTRGRRLGSDVWDDDVMDIGRPSGEEGYGRQVTNGGEMFGIGGEEEEEDGQPRTQETDLV